LSWPASEPAIHLSIGTMDGRVKPGHDIVSVHTSIREKSAT